MKSGRTSYSKTCSCSVATPVAVAMPAPHESVSFAPGAKRWRASSTSRRGSSGFQSRLARIASRSPPSTMRRPIGSGSPATRTTACASTDSRVAGASSFNAKRWSSSMLRDHGAFSSTAGPPVENANSRCPSSAAPASVRASRDSVKRQRTPAGRSSSKVKTHVRASAQRELPFAEHSIANGSAALRGSPSGTIGAEKRALTWRTCLAVPCGAKDSTRAAPAGVAAARAAASASTAHRSGRMGTPPWISRSP